MQTVQYNPNRFLFHWLLSAVCSWPVVGIACIVLWSPLTLVLTMLGGYSKLSLVSEMASIIALILMPSLVIGFFVGNFQNQLLLDELSWEIAGWQRTSLFGAVVGACMVIAASFLQIDRLEIWVMPIFVFGMSSMQWLSMQHESRNAWLWILGNVAAGMVFSGMMFINPPQAPSQMNALNFVLWWALAAAAQGLITGIVMLYLYERPIQEDGRELAPVYIEVRNREDR